MTLEQIDERVEFIRKNAHDDEAAHSYEDHLHQDVLLAISKGEGDSPKDMAAHALATKKIKFWRWCA